MRRLMLLAAGVALAAVPAVIGLADNPSFSHSVPVRLPSGAVRVTDSQTDHPGQIRQGGGHGSDVAVQGAGEGPGKGGGAAVPDATGKGHGAARTPPAAGKDHAAARTPDVPGEGHGAARPAHVVGKDDGAPHVAGRGGRGHATAPTAPTTPTAPTVPPSPGRAPAPAAVPHAQAPVSPPAPGKRAGRPDRTRPGGSRGSSQGVGDATNRAGRGAEKLPF